jgi:hypothetical protein
MNLLTLFRPAALVLALISFPALAQEPAATKSDTRAPKVTLLEGAPLSPAALEIANGKVTGGGVPAGLALDDVSKIEWPTSAVANAETPRVIVELRGEGRLRAREATIDGEQCHVATCFGPRIAVPLEAVRAIRFEPLTASPEFDKAVAAPAPDKDRIFLKVEGKLDSALGLITSLTDKELLLDVEGTERKLARDKLFGIVVAQAQAADDLPPCRATYTDGSVVAGELMHLSKGEIELLLPGGGKLTMPAFPLKELSLRSSRVAFLSDMRPVAEEQSALVTIPRPWQRDKSVSGRPLTLGTKVFEKGIGVHARSELTFAAEGKYDVLAATIGIDAETGGKGDCVFTILADGQPVFSRRKKGTDQPEAIQVEIPRAQQVTLRVEPGEDLDLADHADWAEVRLVRNKK